MDYLEPKKKYTMEEIRDQINAMNHSPNTVVTSPKISPVFIDTPTNFNTFDSMPDDSYDALGYVYRQIGQIAAQKAEKEMFDYLDKTRRESSADPSAIMTQAQGKSLTKEDFQDMIDHLKGTSTPTQMPKDDLGPLTHKYEKRSQMLRDVLIMRQFTELGNPVDKSRIHEMAEDAKYEVFDTAWLTRKYEQHTKFLEWSDPGVMFIVVDTHVNKKYTYAPNKKEYAVYANGYIVREKSVASSISGSFPAGSVSRGKRGIAGQSALDAIKLQMLASDMTNVVIQKPISLEPEFKEGPMVLESSFIARSIPAPKELIDDMRITMDSSSIGITQSVTIPTPSAYEIGSPDVRSYYGEIKDAIEGLEDVKVNSVDYGEDGSLLVDLSGRSVEPLDRIVVDINLTSEGVVNKNGRVYPESSIDSKQSES